MKPDPEPSPSQACFKYPSPSWATHCPVGGLRTLTGFPGGPGGPDGPSGPGSPWKQEAQIIPLCSLPSRAPPAIWAVGEIKV